LNPIPIIAWFGTSNYVIVILYDIYIDGAKDLERFQAIYASVSSLTTGKMSCIEHHHNKFPLSGWPKLWLPSSGHSANRCPASNLAAAVRKLRATMSTRLKLSKTGCYTFNLDISVQGCAWQF
jgi:hypothetical protein